MSKENAIFKDELSSEFSSEFDETHGDDPLGISMPESLDQTLLPEVGDPTDGLIVPPDPSLDFDAPIFDSMGAPGGDAPLPAISIKLFYEQESTCQVMDVCANDRRMGRASAESIPGGIPAAIAYMQENPTPNLLIIESSASAATILEQVDTLAEHCDEHVQVMIIGAVNDISLYRQLIARGVSEYLVPPLAPLQVIQSISNLFSDPDAPFVGKQISVIGAKGGVGASTIAHNLAWAISESMLSNTTLVDLDLSFGTTALDFNQDTPQTVVDALMAPDRADDAVVERLLAKATDRLSLFTAPATVSQIMDIPDEAFSKVIDVVRRNVPVVVLDLPHQWSSWVMNTLVASDEVIVVCQPDLASLRNGKNIIDQIAAKRPNDYPPRLVLNMSGVPKRPEVPVKDFAAAIGVEPEIILPFEPELFGTAANNGQMIAETDAGSRSSMAIDHLAALLLGQDVQPQPKSFIQKLLGK